MDFLAFVYDLFNVEAGDELTFWGVFFTAIGAMGAVLALIGVGFAYHQFRQKNSTKISASCGRAESAYYKDAYTHEVLIKNHRDRPEAIFGIYLRLGRNVYVTLEKFDDQPLILNPFEMVRLKLKPVSGYGLNGFEVDINDAFRVRPKNQTICLATSDGKYVASQKMNMWSPYLELFTNYNVKCFEGFRNEYENKNNGELSVLPTNALYILHYEDKGISKSTVIQGGKSISLNDPLFSVDDECLIDENSLLKHFKEQEKLAESGIDLDSLRVEVVSEMVCVKHSKEFYNKGPSVSASNSMMMQCLGKIYYWIHRFHQRIKNHDRNAKGMSYIEKRVFFTYVVMASLITVAVTWRYFWG